MTAINRLIVDPDAILSLGAADIDAKRGAIDVRVAEGRYEHPLLNFEGWYAWSGPERERSEMFPNMGPVVLGFEELVRWLHG